MRLRKKFASLIPPKLQRVLSKPIAPVPLFQRVVLELQSHCNRDCFFCCRESDTTGKRKLEDGTSVRQYMPTEKVTSLLDELEELGFTGYITFHQLSEAFLDKRLLAIAGEAAKRGMRPYVHTNGDVLRDNENMCRAAAEVFKYIVVGLYDYQTESEKLAEKEFWKERLHGTRVLFSLVENVYTRTHSADNEHMQLIVRQTHPTATCAEPRKYLLIHYNGDICCCCEDMYGGLLKANVFESSIKQIWDSARHREIVENLRFGNRRKYDLCAKCTMGPNHYSADPLQAIQHYDR